jgi:hypothetical protein
MLKQESPHPLGLHERQERLSAGAAALFPGDGPKGSGSNVSDEQEILKVRMP